MRVRCPVHLTVSGPDQTDPLELSAAHLSYLLRARSWSIGTVNHTTWMIMLKEIVENVVQ